MFQDILGLSVESMAQTMTSELLEGCVDDKSVKAGFVGEIGCCYPMNGNQPNIISELKVSCSIYKITVFTVTILCNLYRHFNILKGKTFGLQWSFNHQKLFWRRVF